MYVEDVEDVEDVENTLDKPSFYIKKRVAGISVISGWSSFHLFCSNRMNNKITTSAIH